MFVCVPMGPVYLVTLIYISEDWNRRSHVEAIRLHRPKAPMELQGLKSPSRGSMETIGPDAPKGLLGCKGPMGLKDP